VITRYVIDTKTVLVFAGYLGPHKYGENTVWLPLLSCIAAYRDTDIVYRVPYRAVCIAIHRRWI